MNKTVKIILIIIAAIIVLCGAYFVIFGNGSKTPEATTEMPSQSTIRESSVTSALETQPPFSANDSEISSAETSTDVLETAPTETRQTITDSTQQNETPPQLTTEAPQSYSNSGDLSTKEAVVNKFNLVINELKAQQNVTVQKKVNSTIEVTRLPAESIRSILNKVLGGLVKPTDDTYTFQNGVDSNGETLSGVVAPLGRNSALSPEGVETATAVANGNQTTITIKLLPEESSFDGTNTVAPQHHASCFDPLDLSTIDAGPAKITSAQMKYDGATINLTLDDRGKVTHYEYTLPTDATCTCNVAITSIDIGLNCAVNESYDISYN